MGQKSKSKFTFPVPGRPREPHQHIPTFSISTPLSKAQRVLGTGGINVDSRPVSKDTGRAWDTLSGISISVSESTASRPSTDGAGLDFRDLEKSSRTGHEKGNWEQESDILPRQLHSAHGPPNERGVAGKKSAATIGADYRDAVTDDSYRRRRESSSTIWSHYESAKVPLSISQQTSSSAIAKGIPSKVNSLLDMDGQLAGARQKKKKPSRLDFTILRPGSRKDRKDTSPGIGPLLGNTFVMKSPSLISQSAVSPASTSSWSSQQRSPRKIRKNLPAALRNVPPPDSRPSRGARDTVGLQQLYHHYEQMSFRHDPVMEEDEEDERAEAHERLGSLSSQSYAHKPSLDASENNLSTRSSPRRAKGQEKVVNHSRNVSQESRSTAIRIGPPIVLHTRPGARKEYEASIESRHTRTSKATPSMKSNPDSDRQLNSVLSLSDTDSDEDATESAPPPSATHHHKTPSYHENVHVTSTNRRPSNTSLPDSRETRTKIGHKRGASSLQHNNHLAVPQFSPRTPTSPKHPTRLHVTSLAASSTTREPKPTPPPNSSTLSSGESRSTLGSNNTANSGNALDDHPTPVIEEAKAVSMTPLASTVEAVSMVTVPESPRYADRDRLILRQASFTGSHRISHGSQPTPPLSPTSVEFYIRSPTPSQRASSLSKGSFDEVHNARIMAVTRQEEMLLAALRRKRAHMRENNILAEIDEGSGVGGAANRESRSSHDSASSEMVALAALANVGKKSDRDRKTSSGGGSGSGSGTTTAAGTGRSSRASREGRLGSLKPTNFPARNSSLKGRGGHSRGTSTVKTGRDGGHAGNGDKALAPSSSTSLSTIRPPPHRSNPSQSTVNSRRTGHESIPLYLENARLHHDAATEAETITDPRDFIMDAGDSDQGDLLGGSGNSSRRMSKRSNFSSIYGAYYHPNSNHSTTFGNKQFRSSTDMLRPASSSPTRSRPITPSSTTTAHPRGGTEGSRTPVRVIKAEEHGTRWRRTSNHDDSSGRDVNGMKSLRNEEDLDANDTITNHQHHSNDAFYDDIDDLSTIDAFPEPGRGGLPLMGAKGDFRAESIGGGGGGGGGGGNGSITGGEEMDVSTRAVSPVSSYVPDNTFLSPAPVPLPAPPTKHSGSVFDVGGKSEEGDNSSTSKKNANNARLSAVGRGGGSPMPWWGDDD